MDTVFLLKEFKFRKQNTHKKNKRPVCERSCKRRYSARVNVFVQPINEHWYGRSCVCVRRWV